MTQTTKMKSIIFNILTKFNHSKHTWKSKKKIRNCD